MLTTIFTLCVFTLFSQDIYPPNSGFFETSIIPCPYDSTVEIEMFDNWQVYQTLNDEWDGVVDSSLCISLVEIDSEKRLPLNEIDQDKPLFIRSLVSENPRPYLTDWLYEIGFRGKKSLNLSLNLQDTCKNALCSGLIVGIEIPDTISTDTAMRIHYDDFSTYEINQFGGFDNTYCMPTEKFEFNNLKEYVAKFTFNNANLNNHYLYDLHVNIQEAYDVDLLTEIEAYDFFNGEFYYYLNNYYYYGGLLAKYTADSYPSMDSISYIEATPNDLQTEQQTINVVADEFLPLSFQPFTAIRGALVEGSDSVRHITNIVNEGSELCFGVIVELFFNDHTSYYHKAGTLNFHGKSSCMAFQSGSTLKIGDDATLLYGNEGRGVLNLQPGSNIEIGQNATLNVNTRLSLFGKPKAGQPAQVFMELNPGSTLSFGENGYITNIYAQSPDSKLNIYMNGGILDESNLDVNSRRLINKIYPTAKPVFKENIELFPNPVSEFLTIKITANEAGTVNLNWQDVNGRLLKSEKKELKKGYNFLEMNTVDLSSGIYFLEIIGENGRVVERILKQ